MKSVSTGPSGGETLPDLVVGLGASAGGFAALRQILGKIEPGSGIAFVVAQHLDPSGRGLATEVLGSVARLPVVEVASGTRLRADTVYLVPPHTFVALSRGVFRITQVAERDQRLSVIDALFRAMAGDLGHAAVGIVLSGEGSDGTLGLKAIGDAGGMAIAQAPESAEHGAMPLSAISGGAVDHVLTPELVPAQLLAYASYLSRLTSSNAIGDLDRDISAALVSICEVLQKVTRHDFKHYKTSTLVRRIQRRMQVLQLHSVDAYLELLRARSDEADALFKELLINVTCFFRDPEAFNALREEVLLKLLSADSRERKLRVWVAGCSTGEEAYSVAILVQEILESLASPPDVQVIATDIDESALSVARKGAYPTTIAEDVSPERLRRFFVRKAGKYHVTKELRESVLFSLHNLIADPPFSQIDLITCRNVLIYLGPHLQKKLIPVFHYALRPGGHLFLGASESLSSHKELFRTVSGKYRIAQRKATAIRPAVGVQGAPPMSLTFGPHDSAAGREAEILLIGQRILLDEFAPRYAIVNDDAQIVSVSSGIAAYLEPSEGAFQNNLVRLVKPTLRAGLRNSFREARRTKRKVAHDRSSIRAEGFTRRIEIIVQPMPQLGDGSELYMVVFRDLGVLGPTSAAGASSAGKAGNTGNAGNISPAGDAAMAGATGEGAGLPGAHGSAVGSGDRGLRAGTDPHDESALVEQLERELSAARDDLEKSVQDLEASNEELKSSNEELLSMNEELQSANEELEASKEEVQSANEALQQANTDLENLLASTNIATLFLDTSLRIRSFTPSVGRLYNLRNGDVGRPIGDFAPRADAMPPLPDPAEVAGIAARGVGEAAWEHEVPAGARTYLRRVTPYRAHDGTMTGLVVTFIDITPLKQTRERIERSEQRLELALEGSQMGLWEWIVRDDQLYFSPRALEIFGVPPERFVGNFQAGFVDLVHPDDRERVRAEVAKAVAAKWSYDLEYRLLDAGTGEIRWIQARGKTYYDEETDLPRRMVGTLLDVTARKRTERALAEASQAKSVFLANVSHEIRTPLGAISGFAELLAMPGLTEEERRDYLDCIARNAGELGHLIDELLDLSKVESGKLGVVREPFDPAVVVEEAVSTVSYRAKEKGLALAVRWDVAGARETARGFTSDPHRLRQILVNLLGNAVKFTATGGVTVEACLRQGSDGREIVLTVVDTGVGLSKSQTKNLFEPFSQADDSIARRFGGTGLGLAISRKLARLLGGDLVLLASEPGQGSAFRLVVPETPLNDGAELEGQGREVSIGADALADADSLVVGGKPLRVLIVDDNPDNLAIARKYVETAGGLATTVASGERAVAVCREDPFDVVLLDLQMPGYNGYRVMETVRLLRPALPVVALTAHAMKEDRERTFAAGFAAHVSKPIDRAELVGVLSSIARTPYVGAAED